MSIKNHTPEPYYIFTFLAVSSHPLISPESGEINSGTGDSCRPHSICEFFRAPVIWLMHAQPSRSPKTLLAWRRDFKLGRKKSFA
ncbi:hypothetical protein PoB_003950900 [Plakobranchus ocellatus]|uniref:Uncharacterized protein n=1 Tax=Plakobranchus ocellatus TaxID=259542 RepID=A0AAV4B3R7_9GAST|nr:hypothetical protein PoB_003950900 [Plakobranchus ocellatus]